MAARTKLTMTDREDIFRRVGKGVAVAVLAEEFHVSENCIRVTVKKFKAGPTKRPNPPTPEVGVDSKEEVYQGYNGTGTRPGTIITGIPGINLTGQFKDTVAQMCRQMFEEKIKDALDAIFFKP